VFTTVLSTKMPETVRRDISALAPWAMKKVPRNQGKYTFGKEPLVKGKAQCY